MKSTLLKIAAPLFLLFFVFGMVHYTDAAFPGKQQQNKEFSISSDQAATPNEAKSPVDDTILLLVILCFILPPLAVYLKYNEAGKPFIVNVILTLLCGLPGVIHALIHVLKD